MIVGSRALFEDQRSIIDRQRPSFFFPATSIISVLTIPICIRRGFYLELRVVDDPWPAFLHGQAGDKESRELSKQQHLFFNTGNS